MIPSVINLDPPLTHVLMYCNCIPSREGRTLANGKSPVRSPVDETESRGNPRLRLVRWFPTAIVITKKGIQTKLATLANVE
jgi:hypothetical protein